LFARSFIYSEINTFKLSKFNKINYAFNTFVPILVQEMVYLKAIQKNHPNGRFCVGNCRSKNVSEKIWGELQPHYPPSRSAYEVISHFNLSLLLFYLFRNIESPLYLCVCKKLLYGIESISNSHSASSQLSGEFMLLHSIHIGLLANLALKETVPPQTRTSPHGKD